MKHFDPYTLLPINPYEAKNIINNKTGIYFWFDNKTEKIVYIGIATGKSGLRGRIVSQHLNPRYLEYRSNKHTSKDTFQLAHAIKKISDNNGSVRHGIDKSAFRKSIGRILSIKPGDGTVNYINNNLHLRVYESANIELIKKLEIELIKSHKPVFNTAHINHGKS